ncbi:MAG TPA: AI-2E family transporter, partial [Gemmatimonadaceae bacterium]|nr:AI-2E family transporter [Gemmatimonadaceae bacterium]
PYAGSALTIVATGFAAFVQFEEVSRALIVALCVGVAATAIGMGLNAWIQGRAFRINAVTVFVALLFFGWLWGGWGLLVGVPLLAVAKTTIDRLPSLERFIPLLSDDSKPAADPPERR